ncbi:MAG TPA: M14 family zinc carboxypeptidase [Nocardioidaceae bacterium]|nr:M14 family zinc carboxypeptidase [Nocardioidaceae bacterium]
MTSPRRVLAGAAALAIGCATLVTLAGPPAGAGSQESGQQTAPGARVSGPVKPAVIGTRVIGKSVNGHPIRAWELGEKDAETTAIIFGRHHGNEPAGQVVLDTLRDGNPIHGIDLWVVPRLNPDGALRNTRQNAHKVDLNRNFPWRWKPLTGYYYSGRRPASEPETRAAMRFMNNIDPDYVVSIHTPLYGLDVTHAKDRAFARRLSNEMRLPNRQLRCNGTCHGTLSQWFNHAHKGACVTIEFGANPSEQYLTVRAPRGLVRALGGTRGGPA